MQLNAIALDDVSKMRPAKPPRRLPSRMVILAAARTIMRDRSFESLGLEEVAQAARLTRRTIYNQFLDKNDLYRASRNSLLAELNQQLPQRIDPSLPLLNGLATFAEGVAIALAGEANADLTISLIRDGGHHPWLGAAYERQVTDPLRRAIENFLYAKRETSEFEWSDVPQAAASFLQLIQAATSPIGVASIARRRGEISAEAIGAIVQCFLMQYTRPSPAEPVIVQESRALRRRAAGLSSRRAGSRS